MKLKDLLLENLIFESNQDKLMKLLSDQGKEEYYDKIVTLDPTKNGIFSIKLGKMFLEKPTSLHFNNIKSYFEKYLVLSKKKQIKVDFNSIKSFNEFHNLIDAAESKHFHSKRKKTETEPTVSDAELDSNSVKVLGKTIDKKNIRYIDENVIVVIANTKQDSIKYGSGLSNWCTARKNNNLFYQYRIDGQETMYYVFFLKKNDDDLEKVIHFGLDEDGDISYTDRSNEEYDKNLDWLGKKFPELLPAINGGAFVYVPLTPEESQIQNKVDNNIFTKFDYKTKEMYISYGHEISDWLWDNVLDDSLKALYIEQFDSNDFDLSDHILNKIKGTQLEKRYWTMIGRGLEPDENEEMSVETYHEFLYLKEKGFKPEYYTCIKYDDILDKIERKSTQKNLSNIALELLQNAPILSVSTITYIFIYFFPNDLEKALDIIINNNKKIDTIDSIVAIFKNASDTISINDMSDQNLNNTIHNILSKLKLLLHKFMVENSNQLYPRFMYGILVYLKKLGIDQEKFILQYIKLRGTQIEGYDIRAIYEYVENSRSNLDLKKILIEIIKTKSKNLNESDILTILKYVSSDICLEIINLIIDEKGNELNFADISTILDKLLLVQIFDINTLIKLIKVSSSTALEPFVIENILKSTKILDSNIKMVIFDNILKKITKTSINNINNVLVDIFPYIVTESPEFQQQVISKLVKSTTNSIKYFSNQSLLKISNILGNELLAKLVGKTEFVEILNRISEVKDIDIFQSISQIKSINEFTGKDVFYMLKNHEETKHPELKNQGFLNKLSVQQMFELMMVPRSDGWGEEKFKYDPSYAFLLPQYYKSGGKEIDPSKLHEMKDSSYKGYMKKMLS